MPGRVGPDAEEPEAGHRVALALQGERRHRFDGDRVADELPGPLADEDLAGVRRLLQPGGHVHGVADDHVLATDGVADHHLPGVHPGPQRQPHPQGRLQLGVQLLEGAAQLAGRPHRPQGVVLVQPRDTVDRHHGVADELGHGAAVPSEHLGRPVVVPGDHLPERLGVEPLAERRGPHQVAEDDGDGLADLPRLTRGGQRRPAGQAEAGPRRVVLAAPGASCHGPPTRFRRTRGG